MRAWLWVALAALFCLVVGVWWDLGLQSWLAVHTGTDYCQVPAPLLPACRYYNYHSGFGSVYPFVFLTMGGVLGYLAAHLRTVNCHEQGCWHIGRFPVVGGAFRYCGTHHPDWAGKHPPREHILARHEDHKAFHTPKPKPASRSSRTPG